MNKSIDKLVKTIIENATKEYNSFKGSELKKDKKTLFADCYIINFYCELYDFFTLCDFLSYIFDEKQLSFMAEQSTNLIAQLYSYYLKHEHTHISTWEDITDLINDFCLRGMKNEMSVS